MTAVRAKFVVVEKTSPTTDVDACEIKLQAVVGDCEENKSFFKYTPFGRIDLGVLNPAAANQFVVGREFYVDFIDPNAGTTKQLENKAQSAVPGGFKFALGQRVSIKANQESGQIVSRREGPNGKPHWLVIRWGEARLSVRNHLGLCRNSMRLTASD